MSHVSSLFKESQDLSDLSRSKQIKNIQESINCYEREIRNTAKVSSFVIQALIEQSKYVQILEHQLREKDESLARIKEQNQALIKFQQSTVMQLKQSLAVASGSVEPNLKKSTSAKMFSAIGESSGLANWLMNVAHINIRKKGRLLTVLPSCTIRKFRARRCYRQLARSTKIFKA